MRSLIIEGMDTFADWGLVLSSKELNPPAPKFYTVDIPGGDGNINLTKALNDDTVYENRTQEFVFTQYLRGESFEGLKTSISNFLHGQEFDYKLSWDPDYTYHGWFTVDKYGTDGALNQITITVEADPYKSKGMKFETFNVSDGFVAYLPSGRKRVRPVFEFSEDTVVVFEGRRYVVPKGSHTINDVWLKMGTNEVTFVLAGLQSHITHGEMAKFTNDDLAKKKNWELYKGIEKHYVSKIVVTPGESDLTGVITFTATDSKGNVFTQTLDLGDVTVAKSGDVSDKVVISGGYAVVEKWVDVDEDGTKTVLPLAQSVTLECPELFSNYGEIVSLTHDSTANVTYSTAKMNTELVMRKALNSDYMDGGDYAMTNSQMSSHNHAQLTMINVGEQEVTKESQESVWVKYEWLDL